ncbi:MAG: APC family permease [Steroidobacteraceae bacterium]
MESGNRDSGLVRVVGLIALAASMISMLVGAAIFVVPAHLSAALGSLAPLAMMACAVAIGAIGVCLAESGSRVPSSGGIYASVEAAFGPCAGYVGGTLFWVSNVMACAAVSSALGDAVAVVLPQSIRSIAHATVVVGTVGAICAINIGGVARGMRLVSFATLLKLIPLAIFLGVGVFAIEGTNFIRPAAISPADVGHTLLLTLFAFQGFETVLCASGEVRDPARTIPRALLIALFAVTLLYTAVQIVAQGILGPSLGHSNVPLADAMGKIHPALQLLMLTGAAVSMFGWITADLLSSPRILFAFARDGLLPRSLGRLSQRGRAPYMAIACYGILATVLALSGSFAQLAAPSALVLAALYIAGCAASWQLVRREVAQAGAPLGFRWIGTAVIVGSTSMLALIVLASRTEILGLLVLTGLSLAAYLVQTKVLYPRTADPRQPAA